MTQEGIDREGNESDEAARIFNEQSEHHSRLMESSRAWRKRAGLLLAIPIIAFVGSYIIAMISLSTVGFMNEFTYFAATFNLVTFWAMVILSPIGLIGLLWTSMVYSSRRREWEQLYTEHYRK